MTAVRVVTDHEELENVGQNTHVQIDAFIAAGGSATLPTPTAEGQILIAVTSTTFSVAQPLTSLEDGWLINDDGLLLVGG